MKLFWLLITIGVLSLLGMYGTFSYWMYSIFNSILVGIGSFGFCLLLHFTCANIFEEPSALREKEKEE